MALVHGEHTARPKQQCNALPSPIFARTMCRPRGVQPLSIASPGPFAAVDGEVLAGGTGIALACDIVVATERSRFGLSEVLPDPFDPQSLNADDLVARAQASSPVVLQQLAQVVALVQPRHEGEVRSSRRNVRSRSGMPLV